MAIKSTWPEIDNRPAAIGITLDEATAEAGVADTTSIAGMPPAPTSAIEAVSLATAGLLRVRLANMAAGTYVSIHLPVGVPQFRRLAVVEIHTDTDVGTAGFVNLYWDANPKKN